MHIKLNCNFLYKNGSVAVLSVNTAATDQNYLFRRPRPIVAFESIQSNTGLLINTVQEKITKCRAARGKKKCMAKIPKQ
jgi:hypothetical protein